MAGFAKAPAALADIIVTCSLCYSLGYVRTGVRACVIYVPWRGCSAYHRGSLIQYGLSTQDSDRIRDQTRCCGDFNPGRIPGHVLHAFPVPILVRLIGRRTFTPQPMLIPTE